MYFLAFFDVKFGEVHVYRGVGACMFDDNSIAASAHIAGEIHNAVSRGIYRSTDVNLEVHTPVRDDSAAQRMHAPGVKR